MSRAQESNGGRALGPGRRALGHWLRSRERRRSGCLLLATGISVAWVLAAASGRGGEPKAEPWTVVLPNGGIVELIGVCYYPAENRAWWRPDGSPLAEPPISPVQIDSKRVGFEEDTAQAYQFVIRWSCDPDRGAVWSASPSFLPRRRTLWGKKPLTAGVVDKGLAVLVAGFPAGQRSATLRCSLSVTEVRPVNHRSAESIAAFENVSFQPGHEMDFEARAITHKGIPVPAVPDTVVYGPVIERVLYDCESGRECFIDVDTGKVFAAPENVREILHGKSGGVRRSGS